MKKEFFGEFGNDGGYCVGEKNSELGYFLYPDETRYMMGQCFSNGLNGWVFEGGVSTDACGFHYYQNNKLADNVRLLSKDDHIEIGQISDKKGPYGYTLTIYSSGSWLYQNWTKNSKTRGVYYNAKDKKICVCVLANGKIISGQTIDDDNIEADFSIPFGQFGAETYSSPGDFQEFDNCIQSDDDGPSVDFDKDDEEHISIGCIESEGYEGTVYEQWDDRTSISQYSEGTQEGPEFIVFDNGSQYEYYFYENGEKSDLCIIGFCDSNAIEIRNYGYEDEELYDSIYIDEDFNVSYYDQYDDDAGEYHELYEYNYDEIINGESDEVDDDDEVEEEEEEYDDEDDEVEEDDEEEPDEDEEEEVPVIKPSKRGSSKTSGSSPINSFKEKFWKKYSGKK